MTRYKKDSFTIDDARLYQDDGLFMPEVGPWATTKHRKIGYYCALFAGSMKKKWHCRVYLDLFAGAGKSRIENSSDVIPGSPLLALSIKDPFDQYIFCEQDQESLTALTERVNLFYPDRRCHFIPGDTNEVINRAIKCIPIFSPTFKGLTFCLVDPFKCGQINFATLKTIAESIYVDFLILIPSYMDINRNERVYAPASSDCLDKYLGTDTWRNKWSLRTRERKFGLFIAEELCLQMKELGYIYEGLEDLELVRMETGKNLPLYHLAFFSRNPLGLKFWRKTMKSTEAQQTLW
jgi:three-Cys-motif partner protein